MEFYFSRKTRRRRRKMCKIFANDIAMVFHPVSISIKCIWTEYTEDEKKENFSNGKTLSQRSVSINMGILRYRPTDVLSLVGLLFSVVTFSSAKNSIKNNNKYVELLLLLLNTASLFVFVRCRCLCVTALWLF